MSKGHLNANTQQSEGGSEGIARVVADASDGEVQMPGGLRARVPAELKLAVVMAWRSVNYSLPAALPFVILHTPFHSRQSFLSPPLRQSGTSCATLPLCCAASLGALRLGLHELPMPSAFQRQHCASSTHRERQLSQDLHPYYHERGYLPQSALNQTQLLPRQQMRQTHD
jgi:hypothetical protein